MQEQGLQEDAGSVGDVAADESKHEQTQDAHADGADTGDQNAAEDRDEPKYPNQAKSAEDIGDIESNDDNHERLVSAPAPALTRRLQGRRSKRHHQRSVLGARRSAMASSTTSTSLTAR